MSDSPFLAEPSLPSGEGGECMVAMAQNRKIVGSKSLYARGTVGRNTHFGTPISDTHFFTFQENENRLDQAGPRLVGQPAPRHGAQQPNLAADPVNIRNNRPRRTRTLPRYLDDYELY